MARRTSLDSATSERICGLLRLGNTIEVAARASGVCRDTIYEWLNRAKKGEEPFAGFADDFDQAIAEAQQRTLRLILDAAEHGNEKVGPQWQAAAWIMERRWPNEWGRRERVEHSGPEGRPIEIASAEERIASKLASLLARSGGDPGEPDT
jgi:hypothetical protein